MAVQPQTPYIEYTANGITTSFALEFDCDNKDHLIVLIDNVEPNAGTWSLSGGAVVFDIAPTSGQKITLQRNTPFSRDTNYQSHNNSFRPQSVNGDFDRVWLKLQELGLIDQLQKLYFEKLHNQQQEEINQNKLELQDNINSLTQAVNNADNQLQENINNLKSYSDNKNSDLRDELLGILDAHDIHFDNVDGSIDQIWNRISLLSSSYNLGVKLYATTAQGLANTTNGQYFNLVGADNSFSDLYKNEGGVAVFQNKSSPSRDWKRNPLSEKITDVHLALDSSWINIWEFADKADKRGSTDPALWDWYPAIKQAITYCTNFNATASILKACPTLTFLSGTYTMFSKFTDPDISTPYTYQKTYNLKGNGLGSSVLQSAIENDYMFELSNFSRMIVSDLTFNGSSTINAKCLKLGDEAATSGSSKYIHWCDFTRVYWWNFVQAITIGRLYDSAFNNCAFRGLKGSDTIPSHYISVLDQTTDSTNQLVFNRTGFESVAAKTTVFQEGSAFFKTKASANISTHYCFNFYACHFEGGGQDVKILDISKAFKFNFNGCYFVQTFVRTDGALQLFIELNDVYGSSFNDCFFQEMTSPATWDSANAKMIKIKGNTNGLKFSNCHFKSAGVNTSVTRSYETVFDYSEAIHGENSYVLENCTLNSFTAVASHSYLTLSSKLNSSNRHTISVDDDNSLNFRYTNNDGDKSVRGQSALRLTSANKVETYSDLNIGGIKTTAGDQRLNFVTNGDGVSKAFINVSPSGITTFTASWLTLRSNAGGSDIVLECSAVRPSTSGKLLGTDTYRWGTTYLQSWDIHTSIVPIVTSTSSVGSSSKTVKDIFSQNAVTVVSDERYKSNVQVIPETLLDAWGDLDFNMWQLNAAISEKGESEARWHFGLIAQQVRNVLIAHGLDWTRYGLITYEAWDEIMPTPYVPAVIDDFGNLISEEIEATPYVPAGEIYMLRMEECLAVEAAYQRRRLDRIETALMMG